VLGRSIAWLAAWSLLGGCHYFPDHYLVHPKRPQPSLVTWKEDVTAGDLLIHLLGAQAPGNGPFPTILVHPEGGKTAVDMQGILWDLAERGYVAIAADYERRIDGEYQRSLFAWRSPGDVIAVLDAVTDRRGVDPRRLGVLGFSQGGVFSLLIAAHAPRRVAAVVSYYPVTDFPHWLNHENASLGQRFGFVFVRWYFRRESGARTDAEYQAMLLGASPYYVAEWIQAPVLLVHGDSDTTAPVQESRRMAERLSSLGKPVELMVVPGAVHIFNFRQEREAALAWETTIQWFDRYLRPRYFPSPVSGTPSQARRSRSKGEFSTAMVGARIFVRACLLSKPGQSPALAQLGSPLRAKASQASCRAVANFCSAGPRPQKLSIPGTSSVPKTKASSSA